MSAGPAIGMFKSFIMVGVLGIIFGEVFDKIVIAANTFQLSGDALNTLNAFSIMFKAFFILFLIAILLNHLVEANNESSRGV